jgi:hypothetical protein
MSVRLLTGDSLDMLATLEAGSIGAAVTDPPYGLKFMGKAWDHGVPGVPYWQAVHRVLKPGAWLLAFGGTRTYHRLTCAIEDAGFEIRDCLMWLYGSGFPKGKGCLKPGWEPIVLARKPGPLWLNVDGCRLEGIKEIPGGKPRRAQQGAAYGELGNDPGTGSGWNPNVGRWPANVVLSHEPECREVGTKQVKTSINAKFQPIKTSRGHTGGSFGNETARKPDGHERSQRLSPQYADADGTETVTDFECVEACAVRMLDAQSGERKSGGRVHQSGEAFGGGWRSAEGRPDGTRVLGSLHAPDSGGASRFFATFPSESRLDSSEHVCDNQAWENTDRSQSTPAESATQPPRDTTDSTSGIRSPRAAGKCSCTTTSGNRPMDPSQTATTSTTRTTTSRTTDSTTSSLSIPSPTSACTAGASCETASGGSPVASAASSSLWTPSTGTYPPRGGHSTDDVVRAISAESLPINEHGVTRFLYCPKASRSERREYNSHPTVKPLALMDWLVRLVTPAGETGIDPFCGSGSTLLAWDRLGFDCVGIDADPHAIEITQRRLQADAGIFAQVVAS